MILPEYNLLEQPWLLVSDLKAEQLERVSLLELFNRAHELRGFSGESETQNVSLLRFCLSVLTTVISRYDYNGDEVLLEDEVEAENRWHEWWRAGKLPIKTIERYLEDHRDRFNLFDPSHPFYQDANVGKELDREYKQKPEGKSITEVAKNYLTTSKLVGDLSESANKMRLFKVTSNKTVAFDEAARWLITFMNTDDKSIKHPTPLKRGVLGEIGCIWVEGDSLFETFMLNLVLTEEYGYVEKPAWENQDPIVENRVVVPAGIAELYSFQSRRIILDRQKGEIVSFHFFDPVLSNINFSIADR